MYTIWLANRAHIIDDNAAEVVREALAGGRPLVEVDLQINPSSSQSYRATLNTTHILALIQHPERDVDCVGNVIPLIARG